MIASGIRDFAQQLLAREELEGGVGKETSVTSRVCDKLRRSLSKLIGPAAFRALLTRALALAKAESSCLGAVQIAADGSLTGVPGTAECPKEEADCDCKVTLIAHLIGLLVALIGRALTVSLVREVWSGVSFDVPQPPAELKP